MPTCHRQLPEGLSSDSRHIYELYVTSVEAAVRAPKGEYTSGFQVCGRGDIVEPSYPDGKQRGVKSVCIDESFPHRCAYGIQKARKSEAHDTRTRWINHSWRYLIGGDCEGNENRI